MRMTLRVAAAIVMANLLGAGRAPAMDILRFARLNLDDQATYVSQLVAASAGMLRTNGQPGQADKAIALFKDSTSHGGVSQLAENLKTLQAENIRNETNPNNRKPAYDVEAALQRTLRQNGVDVPLKFLEGVNRNFQPFYPLRAHANGV